MFAEKAYGLPCILPALATLMVGSVSSWIAYRAGKRSGKIAQEGLNIVVTKARPRIGSRTGIVIYGVPNRPEIRRNAVVAKIYNDGDLVARNVQGECKLTASQGLKSGTKTISLDSLPTLLPWETQFELSNNAGWLQSHPEATVKVDINLVFSGLDGAREEYHAAYEYDHKEQAMVQSR